MQPRSACPSPAYPGPARPGPACSSRATPSLALAAGVLGAVLSPALHGQCLSDDGLSGSSACALSTPNLPSFPAQQLQARTLCWEACALTGSECADVSLGAPLRITGSQYTASLLVSDCQGQPLLQGWLVLDYTRNWTELSPQGTGYEVFRFVAKADLSSPPGPLQACATPLCAKTPGASSFYYGYVDYARDCSGSTFESALVLHHASDAFIHDSALSAVPGNFHAGKSFAIVAPDTPGNPFAPAFQLPPPATSLGLNMVREVSNATPNSAEGELVVPLSSLGVLGSGCLDSLSSNPVFHSSTSMGGGCCGWTYFSLDLYPTTPWIHAITTSIGRWSNASSYPGTEHASVVEGLFAYVDPCGPVFPGPDLLSVDVYYGSLTQGGNMVLPDFTELLTSEMSDLASNFSLPPGGSFAPPLFGAVAPTDHLVYSTY